MEMKEVMDRSATHREVVAGPRELWGTMKLGTLVGKRTIVQLDKPASNSRP